MEIVFQFMILALLFAAGCVIGWGLEVFYRRFKPSNKERVWINPGFLTGPYLPLYGFGLTLLYLMAGLERYIDIGDRFLRQGILFLLMAAAMTLIELIAGEIFIISMHIKLWDYTDMRFNYKCVICMRFSIYWAALGAVYYFLIHPRILRGLAWFSHNLLFSFVIGFFYGVFVIDLITTFRLVDKIKRFASENEMVIRYDELKKHVRRTALEKKEKYRFLYAWRSETSIAEHLKTYMEKQLEAASLDRLNDFISRKKKDR